MRKDFSIVYLILFICILLPMNIAGHVTRISGLAQLSKPLLLLVLMGYFVNITRGYSSRNKTAILMAMVFSWVGDVALMFDRQYPILFIVGLGGFLLAHLNYTYVFIRSGKRIYTISRLAWIGIPLMMLYTVGLISNLWPHLNELKIPVFVYAIVLMFMGLAAVIRNTKVGYHWVLLGAILFVISDSFLAVNKFIFPIEYSDVYIMTTYGLAQLFIVLGLSKLIISKDHK